MIYTVTALISCFKLLLLPAYKSTDYEVHRNWLAITHSLPVKKWYYEDTSPWTLDYPPFFAWFEYILSIFAQYFDKEMLVIDNLNYDSPKTTIFQRSSVIITDLLFAYGVSRVCRVLSGFKKVIGWSSNVVLPILLLTNAGLLMLDHIHFQYNGMLYGVLLISVSYMIEERFLCSAFWFAVLINLKHIYIYMAPVYFMYLLRNYCLTMVKSGSQKFINIAVNYVNFFKLSAIVVAVFLVSFGPFYNQMAQVLTRLFPFKRGLSHAYWAPNFWAIYNFVDRLGTAVYGKLNGNSVKLEKGSSTSGLVGDINHTFLPQISPAVTLFLTVLFILPAVYKLFRNVKNPIYFLKSLVICSLTAFLFGWHVHEKAILMAIIPLSISAILNQRIDAKCFLLLSVTGHYSIFPLLEDNNLTLIKLLLVLLHFMYSYHMLNKLYFVEHKAHNAIENNLLNVWEKVYILGFSILFIYAHFLHFLLVLNKILPFLPLMCTSVYCAVGVVYVWARYYYDYCSAPWAFGLTVKQS